MGAFLMLIVILCGFGVYVGVKLMEEGNPVGAIMTFVCGVMASGILTAMTNV